MNTKVVEITTCLAVFGILFSVYIFLPIEKTSKNASKKK